MKILHIGPVESTDSANGVSQSIRGLISAQTGIGLRVGLLSSLPLFQEKFAEECPEVCLIGSSLKKYYNPWWISRNWVKLIQAKFGIPDLVQFHSTYIPFQTALARRFRQLGWPYIVTAHGGMCHLSQKVKRTQKNVANFLAFRNYVKHATAIHALCSREASDILELFKVRKIIIVPNGIDDYLLETPEKLSPADLRGFSDGTDLVLGFIGRIDMYHKGIDLLLKAIAILKSGRFNCKVFVIDPFSRKKDKLSLYTIVESSGLQNAVKLLGPKYGDEKLRYLLACDVFVHTSRYEGMPMTVLEAMALGKPCLVTPGTNIADVVCQGGGWQCQANPESIAEAINRICEKKSSIKDSGQRSRHLVQTRFSWRKIAQQLSGEYEKILNQN